MPSMLLCYLPLACCLTCTLWRRREALLVGASKPSVSALPLAVVLTLQGLWAASFVLAYGYIALVLGFLLVGTPVVSVVSWQRARTLPYHRLEKYERFVSGTAGGGAASYSTRQVTGKACSS